MKLARFDHFPKIERRIQHATTTGGILTLLVAVGLASLMFSELSQYLEIKQTYEFLVDQGHAGHSNLQINIDLTVAMACEGLRADVLDVAGTSLPIRKEFVAQPAVFHTRGARRLGQTGGVWEGVALDVHNVIAAANKNFNGHGVGQGSASESVKNGCRVHGSITVSKVSGMLHFTALGHGYMDGKHIDHEAMNFSHRIDKLSFGNIYPGLVNPLDHSLELATNSFEMFQYFVSVVPTIYIDKDNLFTSKVLLTNQYAVTDYSRVIGPSTGVSGIPGIFIKYEIEPISVRVTESRASFLHFLTRLCGIIGGIYVTVGLVNNILAFFTRNK